VSPYRDRRVLVAVGGLIVAGVALILLVNRSATGSTRTVATLAIAVAMWIGLMAVLRRARGG
jgi:hypothetical protein